MKQFHISWRSWRLGGKTWEVSCVTTPDYRVPALTSLRAIGVIGDFISFQSDPRIDALDVLAAEIEALESGKEMLGEPPQMGFGDAAALVDMGEWHASVLQWPI